MRIQNLLSENYTPAAPEPIKLTFRDLNSLQVGLLLKIANGEVDVDSANEKQFDIMSDMVEMGLLTRDYDLSPSGAKAVEIAQKTGGSAELADVRRRQDALRQNDATDPRGNIQPADVDSMVDSPEVDDPYEEVDDDDEFDFNRF